MANEYKQTMNLPKTKFPMRAALAQREPERLKRWQQNHVYELMLKKNQGHEKFVLHDGPPYANGPIHLGHAMNKIAKDMINRYKAMQGYETPYVPGWDCHGQPIEHKVETQMGTEKFNQASTAEIRELCNKFAVENIDLQREGFKRLGVLGDWDNPYLTLYHQHDAADIEAFKAMFDRGMVYRGHKPVHWCKHCHTALAEAEIEYADETSPSIYVRFELTSKPAGLESFDGPVDFVIWTTTPWTIPSDQAVSLKPEAIYTAIEHDGRAEIMLKDLAEKVCGIAGWDVTPVMVDGKPYEVPAEVLDHLHYKQPVFDGVEGVALLADYVGTEDGTGIVHNSPGHGVDDYYVCMKEGMDVCMPVDDDGRFYNGDEFGAGGPFSGMDTDEANPHIIQFLRDRGMLVAEVKITHSYPHCWRCHHPIIFRATEQWFCSIAKFREDVYKAIDTVTWMPDWGHDRMKGMVRDRNDWCISRQRTWGVPIPAFYCKKCGTYHITDATIKAVSDLFRKEGSDAWYKYEAEQIIPAGEVCEKCGASEWTKDTDIMDVWFDSGSTHAAVLEERPELRFPADMYMEGGDQFRGWFQSSLLTSVASKGCAPYKSVLCHGWVVDEQGKQMHKSAGNGVEPSEIIKDYGADIIRLWVASSDYTVDVRAGKNIFKQLSEAYRKIRNTARFILGNLDGFDPNTDCVADDQLQEIDRWALAALDDLIVNTSAGYAVYDFNKVYHAVYNFCVVAMSNFYLDVTKDRLYCTNGAARKAAQTTMYKILVALDKIIAPILCFTSQEIWDFMPKTEGMNKYVVFEDMPKAGQYAADDAFKAKWAQLIAVRDEVKKVLEQARAEKIIGASLEAAVTLYCNDAVYDLLNSIPMDELADLMIVSQVELVKGEGGAASAVEGLGVAAAHATGEKCERCWKYSATIGSHAAHPTLCARCASVVEA